MGEMATIESLARGALVAGRFRVEALAGAGGGGLVYRALDEESGEHVALKHSKVLDENHRKRFLREAEVLAQLDHPAIVGHVAHGEDEGVPYLAMQWIDGETLEERLDGGSRLGVDETLTLGIRVADALAAAHDAGLLHRDVKPGNILLQDDRLDRAVLVDFGLARPEVEAAGLTKSGVVLGTPAYMAPEQARGKRRDIDPRSDVFSVGAVLWECLTGVRAFAADNPLGIIHAVLNVEPPFASELASAVPQHLSRLLHRCLSKTPDKRPPDGAALRIALRSLQPSSEPVGEVDAAVASAETVLPGDPRLVWALLMDTNRWDRIAGAPATTYRHDDPTIERVGKAQLFGAEVEWREVGEWIEGRWFWGSRRYSTGPFSSIDMRFAVEPHPEGTHVAFRAWSTPAPGRPAQPAAMLAGHLEGRIAKYFDKLTELLSAHPEHAADPAEPAALAARRLLTHTRSAFLLGPAGDVDLAFEDRSDALPPTEASKALLTHLAHASDQQVRQMRPRALAKDLSVAASDLVDACFAATEAGLVDLQLQLDCPACRVAAQVLPSIEALSDHAHCADCHADFPVALDENVEVVFHPNGAVREVATEVWCAGSPVFRPHVYATLRIPPRGQREEPIDWPPGSLVVRVAGRPPQTVAPPEGGLQVTVGSTVSVTPVEGARLLVANQTDRQLQVAVERAEEADERITLADALAIPSLHRWVGQGSDRRLGRSVLTVWVGEVDGLLELCRTQGDGTARTRVGEARAAMRDAVESSGGAVLEESSGGRLLACFAHAADAETASEKARAASPLPLRLAAKTGPCLIGVGPRGVELFGATPAECAASLR